MKGLHQTQDKLLNLLRTNYESPLTIREIQQDLGISSPSVVYHHIQQLEKKGYLKRNIQHPKEYDILSIPDKPVVYLNLFEMTEQGPGVSIFDLSPVERIPVASRLLKFPANEAFMLEAKGDSMEPIIKSGDFIIARKQDHAHNGDLIVCINNSETQIKKYSLVNGAVILQSTKSEKYYPFLASNDFRIEGVVKNIYKYD